MAFQLLWVVVMLIGISGKKFVGKDTVATLLAGLLQQAHVTSESAAFADALKRVASNISGIPLNWFYAPELKESAHHCCGKSPRQIMEEANAVFKDCWGDDVFVRTVAHRWEKVRSRRAAFIVTDVRFQVEADWVRSEGGVLVHVLRNTGHKSKAASEQGVPSLPQDIVIENNGTKEQLKEAVAGVFFRLLAFV